MRWVLLFTTVTVVFHVCVFIVESFLWMNPFVYVPVVNKIAANTAVAPLEQARVLQILFFNQGFYNFFVACGGIAGLWFYRSSHKAMGLALIINCCLFAVGAGLVLLLSVSSPIGAALQAGPALLALVFLWRSKQTVLVGGKE